MSDTENHHIVLAAKEVLVRSKRENNYKEVAITYDMTGFDANNSDSYAIVFGDEQSAKFLSDEKTMQIYDRADGLFIINLHNHPNNTDFSLEDLAIFFNQEKIKLMVLVNPFGEIAFLQRHERQNYFYVFENVLLSEVPDFSARIESYSSQLSERKNYFSLLSNDEKENIRLNIIKQLSSHKIMYQSWVNQNTAKNIDFTAFTKSERSDTETEEMEEEYDTER